MTEHAYPYKVREDVIDGLGPWLWPAKDTGAWDGPVDDWVRSHRDTILGGTKQRRSCIQAGGNCGLYPALLSQIFGEVWTFEPDDQNRYFLDQNVAGHNNVLVFPFALGAENRKTVGMRRVTEDNVGMHQVDEFGEGVIMRTIDSIFGDIDVDNEAPVDLLWLDLEGYEYLALLGAAKTITKCLPMIGVERPGHNVVELLTAAGYRKFSDSMMDTFFIHESKWP